MLKKKFFLIFVLTVFLLNLGLSAKGNVLSSVYHRKGAKALSREEYPEAIVQLRKALELSPQSGKIKKTLTTALNNYSFSLGDEKREEAIGLLEEALRVLPEEEALKRNLAGLYNNGGLAFLKEGNLKEAIRKFRKALEVYPAGEVCRVNLGGALRAEGCGHFNNGRLQSAVVFFQEALKYLPEKFDVWDWLGESYYRLDRLKEAINCWDEAEKLSPENKFLQQKLAKAKKEWSVQKDFGEYSSGDFKINFSPEFSRDKAYEIYDCVKEAIWSVGRDFGRYPKEKFSVFVYQEEQFGDVFDPGKHLAGLFNGKIHLKINLEMTTERIAEVIRHEYTHAVVFWITGGKCPLWFNEGLACFEEKKDKKVDFTEIKALAQQDNLIPLSRLSESFLNLADLEQASLAYSQAYSVVKYIIDEHGFWNVCRMLTLFKTGKREKEVIKEVLRLELEDLEENWREKLLYE